MSPSTPTPARLRDLAELRSYIGCAYPPRLDDLPDEPVRVRDIRNYVEGTGDLNPLWSDDAYAQEHGLGGLVAPSGFVEAYAPNYRAYRTWGGAEHLRRTFPFDYPFEGDGLPRVVLLSEELRQSRPVRPGDTVLATSHLTDVDVKVGAAAGRLVRVTFEKVYRTPEDEHLATVIWTEAATEREFDMSAVTSTQPGEARNPLLSASPADITPTWTGQTRPEIKGLTAPIGLPRLVQPLSMTLLIKWTAAVWDMGVPHFDADYVKEVYGLDAPLAHGPLMAALHRRAVTDWLTPRDLLASHRVEFRSPCVAGDTVTVATTVDQLDQEADGTTIAEVSAVMTKQDGSITSISRGRCILRDGGERRD